MNSNASYRNSVLFKGQLQKEAGALCALLRYIYLFLKFQLPHNDFVSTYLTIHSTCHNDSSYKEFLLDKQAAGSTTINTKACKRPPNPTKKDAHRVELLAVSKNLGQLLSRNQDFEIFWGEPL